MDLRLRSNEAQRQKNKPDCKCYLFTAPNVLLFQSQRRRNFWASLDAMSGLDPAGMSWLCVFFNSGRRSSTALPEQNADRQHLKLRRNDIFRAQNMPLLQSFRHC